MRECECCAYLSQVEQLCIDGDYITDTTDSVIDYDYNYCLLQRRPDACSTRQAVDRARSIRKDHMKGRNSWQASGATACQVWYGMVYLFFHRQYKVISKQIASEMLPYTVNERRPPYNPKVVLPQLLYR